jgi:hypothetical protein
LAGRILIPSENGEKRKALPSGEYVSKPKKEKEKQSDNTRTISLKKKKRGKKKAAAPDWLYILSICHL